ncbi:uncharacterized protein LOC130986146 [Salvia miltiorrhiza]|uniref:uncharacterized protein LOC130986146 n=1 Tax=Salvia miltiorrhiza TaxID=226208 RepID=UPI0025ACA3CB|nr:uncharacterized protein LOC130986146 [Salvia miltiorrhiza]
MTYFSGNFFHGTAIKIQCRVFLIPWNGGIISCAKGRSYSSSPLVRYIPRKAVKKEENGANSLPPRYLEQKRIGPESSVGRFEFYNEPSRSNLDVNSKSDGPCLPSDVDYELNLAVEEDIDGDLTAVADEFIEEPDKAVEDNRCCGIRSGP